MPSPTSSKGRYLAHGALAVSGFAGLGYEIVWTRMSSLALGHELPAMLAVVSAFFGGLCLGAWATDGVISRSSYPGRWYVACELIVGLWSLASIALLPLLDEQVVQWMGVAPSPWRQWALAFGVPLVALLPATAAMGATLPAIDRLVGRWRRDGRVVGGLYSANTFGAVFGVLVATLWLIPTFGYRTSLCILAALNFLCAATILLPAFRQAWPPACEEAAGHIEIAAWRLDATLFFTGLLGIGFQALAVSVMSQVTENTVYSFASALAVYLLGTAIGAAAYQRYLRARPPRELLAQFLIALSAACLFGVLMLAQAQAIYEDVSHATMLGAAAPVAAEAALAAAVFGPSTLVMGATFCHLSQSTRGAGGGIGRALGVNTLGGSSAAVVFAVGLLPLMGAKWALALASAGYLALLPAVHPRYYLAAIVPVCLLLALPQRLVLVEPPEGGRILAYREGLLGAVSVVTDRRQQRYLKVNNRFHMGATANPANERRLAHIPLLLHAAPKDALFLGIGTGSTLSAAAAYPNLSVTGVELLPDVVAVQPMFAAVTGDLAANKSLTMVTADARRFVRATNEKYDVIVADLFHPARDGAGGLYTREHFLAIRGLLQSDGVVCQWLPLYQMDRTTTAAIVRTFLDVFPNCRGYYSHLDVDKPVLGLIAWERPTTYRADWFRTRITESRLRQTVMECGLTDGLTLFGLHAASADELVKLGGNGPLNTDDFPVVTFHAPRFVYEGAEDMRGRLAWLLDSVNANPAEQLTPDSSEIGRQFTKQLENYVAARDVFLRGELARTDGDGAQALDAYVQSAKLSPEFEIGYLLACSAAQQIAAAGQTPQAIALLDRLIAVAPDRTEARQLKAKLIGSGR